jgi:hypothetical protein
LYTVFKCNFWLSCVKKLSLPYIIPAPKAAISNPSIPSEIPPDINEVYFITANNLHEVPNVVPNNLPAPPIPPSLLLILADILR